MISPDVCSCCGEIWNRENLKNIPLGKHELHLCPDCYAEYFKPFDKIMAEINEIEINGHIRDAECFRAGINIALNVLDKYRQSDK